MATGFRRTTYGFNELWLHVVDVRFCVQDVEGRDVRALFCEYRVFFVAIRPRVTVNYSSQVRKAVCAFQGSGVDIHACGESYGLSLVNVNSASVLGIGYGKFAQDVSVLFRPH